MDNLEGIVRDVVKEFLGKAPSAANSSPTSPVAPTESAPKPSLEHVVSDKVQKTFFQREAERKAKNEEVIARWLRNTTSISWKPNRYQLLRTGSAKPPVASETAPAAEPRYNLIPSPKDAGLLKRLLSKTTARLGVWRSGPRPVTKVALDFLADHAIAKEAVYEEFSSESAAKLGLAEIKSQIKGKEEFLLRPDLGRQLDPTSQEWIRANCTQNADVQIIVSDGLSGISLKVNIEALLPALIAHFKAQGLTVGTPLYCRFARVILQDRVGEITKAKTNIILIGERPGLGTGDGLSAYLIYQPNPHSTHANRNCISNIHPRGLTTDEAVKTISFTVQKMLEQKTSGVELELT